MRGEEKSYRMMKVCAVATTLNMFSNFFFLPLLPFLLSIVFLLNWVKSEEAKEKQQKEEEKREKKLLLYEG